MEKENTIKVVGLRSFYMMLLLGFIIFITSCKSASIPITAASSNSKTVSERSFPNYEYDGNDPIERLVYETDTKRDWDHKTGNFLIVSPKIQAVSNEGNLVKIFFISVGRTFIMWNDGTFSQNTSWCFPVASAYEIQKGGKYILQKYEIPSEGSYEKSIRAFCRTPVTNKEITGLADEMMNMNFTELDKNLKDNLQKYLNKNDLENMQ